MLLGDSVRSTRPEPRGLRQYRYPCPEPAISCGTQVRGMGNQPWIVGSRKLGAWMLPGHGRSDSGRLTIGWLVLWVVGASRPPGGQRRGADRPSYGHRFASRNRELAVRSAVVDASCHARAEASSPVMDGDMWTCPSPRYSSTGTLASPSRCAYHSPSPRSTSYSATTPSAPATRASTTPSAAPVRPPPPPTATAAPPTATAPAPSRTPSPPPPAAPTRPPSPTTKTATCTPAPPPRAPARP